MNQAKTLVRKEMKKKLLALSTHQLQLESQIVADIIRKLPQYQTAKGLACFVSMEKGEINTNPLLKYCFEDKKKVYLPVVHDGDNKDEMMMLHTFNYNEIYDVNKFKKSKWGIWEPNLKYDDNNFRENAMDSLSLDLMIIPGVAFNKKNYRLGHGKGHYDKYFAKYKQCLDQNNDINDNQFPYLIGIGLSIQLINDIPVDNYDWTLNKIVVAPQMNNPNDNNT